MHITGRSVATQSGIEIEIEEGRIAALRSVELSPDAPYLAPGFIDLQVNGYRGRDYSAADLTETAVSEIAEMLAASGTTTHLPTVITAAQGRLLSNIRTIATAVSADEALQAAVPALHVEGPYISHLDGPRGVHDPRFVRDPSIAEYEAWQEAAGGRIAVVTVAPERDGALPFIERLSSDGVVVAIGHSAAEPSRIGEAVAAGARLSTHLGNGSHAQLPRLRNYVWEQLAQDQLSASIIADGFHLPRSVVKVFAAAKGAERLLLVSDVAPLAGAEPGIHSWGNLDVEVHRDGHLGMPGTEFLAGAGYLLDRCVAQYANLAATTIAQAIRACTVNPAVLLGLTGRSRGLVTGAPADIVQFRFCPGWDRIQVEQTVRGGRRVYAAGGGTA